MKTIDKDEHKVEFYNPNNIVIAKYKKYDQEEFDLFVMSKFLYMNNDKLEFGKSFRNINIHQLIGLLNANDDNYHYMNTVHYGDYFSNINIEYYIPLTEVYTLMEKTDILNKGYVNNEDMRFALEYIINNYNEKRIMQKMEPKQRIRRK